MAGINHDPIAIFWNGWEARGVDGGSRWCEPGGGLPGRRPSREISFSHVVEPPGG